MERLARKLLPLAAVLLAPLGLGACAASAATTGGAETPKTADAQPPSQADDDEPADVPPAEPGAAVATTAPAAQPGGSTAATPHGEKLPTPPPALPSEVQAGTIERTALQAVLEQGVGRFLQRVRVEPQRTNGQFDGWLLHEIFRTEPALREASVLQPGDLVVRVNNHSVQRPEQFLAVWQSLSTAGEINIDVVRAGQASRVRYLIRD